MWQPDVLPGFEQHTIELADDDAGPVVATLVRSAPNGAADLGTAHATAAKPMAATERGAAITHDPSMERNAGVDLDDAAVLPARAALYLHGWNSYFHHEELARFFTDRGVAFYALDLRRYGRSLRPDQVPCYVSDLALYDEEIGEAVRIIGEEQPGARLTVIGHSTGGLVACLWARRHPDLVDALALISPWLETQGSVAVRTLATPVVHSLTRLDPMAILPQVDVGFYGRSLHRDLGGQWAYRLDWQPSPQFPVRAGWLRAILAGHAAVAAGLHLALPVLTLLAERSHISPRWSEDMRTSDIVIDVEVTAARALHLARSVTVARIEGALHDIPLSDPPARERCYEELAHWLDGYS